MLLKQIKWKTNSNLKISIVNPIKSVCYPFSRCTLNYFNCFSYDHNIFNKQKSIIFELNVKCCWIYFIRFNIFQILVINQKENISIMWLMVNVVGGLCEVQVCPSLRN